MENVIKGNGRAEYEDITGRKLFERQKPSEIYDFPEEGKGVGMITGKRGSGKTFFGKKLLEEVGGKFYFLDKDRLVYEVLEESENSKLILVDDLHYYLQGMRLRRLRGYKVKEEIILNKLCGFKKEAEEKNMPLVFISDEGPAGLYYSFEKEENQKRFLELFKDCICSSDDVYLINSRLGYFAYKRSNTLVFREKIKEKTFARIREELKIKDVPLSFPLNDLTYTIITNWPERGAKASNFRTVFATTEGEEYLGFFTNYEKTGWTTAEPQVTGSLRPIREFKVISDKLGEVSRKTLGIEYGEYIENVRLHGGVPAKKGWVYGIAELKKFSKAIQKKYREITERGKFLPLAKAMLYCEDENEMLEFMLSSEMEEEHP